jgi:hypothetical protein
MYVVNVISKKLRKKLIFRSILEATDEKSRIRGYIRKSVVRSAELYPYQSAEDAYSQKEHPALQNMKFLHFYIFFYIIFAFLDPDLQTQLNPVQNNWNNVFVPLFIALVTFYA